MTATADQVLELTGRARDALSGAAVCLQHLEADNAALRARCEEQAAYIAQVGDVSGQLNAAVAILCEKAGGTREGWNTIIAERLRQRRASAHQQT